MNKKVACNLLSLFSVIIFFVPILNAQDTPLPYFCGFEKDDPTTKDWKLPDNYRHQTKIIAGEAIHNLGKQSLYSTFDDGATNGYKFEMTNGWVIGCYKTFTLPAGEYNIIFDYRADVDDRNNLDIMKVALVPESEGTRFTSDTQTFPKTIENNELRDSQGRNIFGATDWTTVSIIGKKITVPGNYNLVFAFRNAEPLTHKRGGIAIDNFQLLPAVADVNACNVMPSDLKCEKSQTGMKISWKGNSPLYEVAYYPVKYTADTTVATSVQIQVPEYVLSHFSNPEGPYIVKVRAVCTDGSVSPWISTDIVYLYNPVNYAIDYLNFRDEENVKCYTGYYKDEARDPGVQDAGPLSVRSMHTIHYDTTAYDRLTGYGLRTVKPGMHASVRLGSWLEGTKVEDKIQSGRMEYLYTVPADKSILLFHYAAVLQFAENHNTPDTQTSIKIEVYQKSPNGNWNPMGYCQRADFNSWDIAGGAYSRPWKTFWPNNTTPDDTGTDVVNKYTESGVLMPIYWLDWQVLGVDLSRYIGQQIMLRITMSACEADYHFAYCYFAMECIEKAIQGMSCSGKATDIYAPEGFKYRWYNTCTGEEVGERTGHYAIAETDTSDYSVDLIFLEPEAEVNGCYFTLNAHTLPRLPESKMRYEHRLASERESKEVQLFDMSLVNRYWNGDTIPETEIQIDRVHWDCGEYGTFNDRNPVFDVPINGDTFCVTLTSWVKGCEDTKEFVVEIPDLVYNQSDTLVCYGESVWYNGKYYTENVVIVDTAYNIDLGIDVVSEFRIDFLKTDTIADTVMVCSHELPYIWSDTERKWSDTIAVSGYYEHGIPGSIDCDSLLYILYFTVVESLDVVTDKISEICGDDSTFIIAYSVLSGDCAGYTVEFERAALDAGFDNIGFVADTSESVQIKIRVPESVVPNGYSAYVTYSNYSCGSICDTLRFDVLYPGSVITQRWNDVLAVKNSFYNGGYNFVGYQWYHNGQSVDGHNFSQLYEEGNMLDFSGEYRVLLTRDDGVSVMTCPFVPVAFDEGTFTEISTVVFAGTTVAANVPQNAVAYIYSVSGTLYSEFDLSEGSNSVAMPAVPGIYVMKIMYAGGLPCETIKIVVR